MLMTWAERVQLAAYLAGFKHALKQHVGGAPGTPQPPPPPLQQPQLNQYAQFPTLYQALAQQQQQPFLYGAPLLQQAGPADQLLPEINHQRQDVSSCPFLAVSL